MNINLLAQALEASTNSIVFTDAEGRISYVNPAFVEATGYSAEEVLGKNPSVLKSGEFPDSKYRELWETIRAGNTWIGVFHNRRKNGTLFWERATIFPVISEDGEITHFVAIKEDISSERHAQEMLNAVVRANQLLLQSNNLDETIHEILKIFGNACGVDRSYLFSLQSEEPVGPTLTIRSEWNSGSFAPQINNPELQSIPIVNTIFEDWVKRLGNHEPVSVLTTELPPAERKIIESQEIQSLLLLPVHSGTKLFGFVGFDDCRSPRAWPDREINTLRSVASSIGIALQKKAYQDEIQEAFLRVQEAADAALEATAAKSAFLATMSHEIRTPLNGILGMTQILLEEKVSPDQREFIETIHRSGQTLHTIVNDILDLAKIEAGKMQIANRSFYLTPVAREVIDLYRANARKKSIDLRLEVVDPFPTTVKGDPDRMRQILSNLVSNAIKFTDSGSVTVRLKTEEPSRKFFRIEVEDTGIGIDSETGKNLFQMFTQADTSSTRRHGGTGLGLAICRRLAEAMEGEIHFESEVGKGTVFIARFPFESPKDIPGGPDDKQTVGMKKLEAEVKATTKVLLAEDDAVNRRVIRLQLEKMGIHAEVVADGEEAVRVYQEKGPFDLIFMDCQMPRMNGFEAAKNILNTALERPPFIIALTASSQDVDKKRAKEAGMKDFLIKPVSISRIREVVHAYQSSLQS